MSTTERAVGVVKSVLLFRETLDRIQAQLGELRSDLKSLSASHAVLAERVAVIEGYVRGRADQAVVQHRLPDRDQ